MPNLLQQALHTTQVARDTVAARKLAEKNETAALVAALHAAFLPYEADVLALPMNDYYNQPPKTVAHLLGADQRGIRRANGLLVPVSGYPAHRVVALVYTPRDAEKDIVPSVRIYVATSEYGPVLKEGKDLDAFTPPEELLGLFFAALAQFGASPE